MKPSAFVMRNVLFALAVLSPMIVSGCNQTEKTEKKPAASVATAGTGTSANATGSSSKAADANKEIKAHGFKLMEGKIDADPATWPELNSLSLITINVINNDDPVIGTTVSVVRLDKVKVAPGEPTPVGRNGRKLLYKGVDGASQVGDSTNFFTLLVNASADYLIIADHPEFGHVERQLQFNSAKRVLVNFPLDFAMGQTKMAADFDWDGNEKVIRKGTSSYDSGSSGMADEGSGAMDGEDAGTATAGSSTSGGSTSGSSGSGTSGTNGSSGASGSATAGSSGSSSTGSATAGSSTAGDDDDDASCNGDDDDSSASANLGKELGEVDDETGDLDFEGKTVYAIKTETPAGGSVFHSLMFTIYGDKAYDSMFKQIKSYECKKVCQSDPKTVQSISVMFMPSFTADPAHRVGPEAFPKEKANHKDGSADTASGMTISYSADPSATDNKGSFNFDKLPSKVDDEFEVTADFTMQSGKKYKGKLKGKVYKFPTQPTPPTCSDGKVPYPKY